MKTKITLKNVPYKELIANHIVDESNTTDIVMETLMRKSIVKRQFAIIKDYYVYLNKGDYAIESLL